MDERERSRCGRSLYRSSKRDASSVVAVAVAAVPPLSVD